MKNKNTTKLSDDVLWGCSAIANEIGRNERITFHLLQTGSIPGIKAGRVWTTTRTALRQFFNSGPAHIERMPTPPKKRRAA